MALSRMLGRRYLRCGKSPTSTNFGCVLIFCGCVPFVARAFELSRAARQAKHAYDRIVAVCRTLGSRNGGGGGASVVETACTGWRPVRPVTVGRLRRFVERRSSWATQVKRWFICVARRKGCVKYVVKTNGFAPVSVRLKMRLRRCVVEWNRLTRVSLC